MGEKNKKCPAVSFLWLSVKRPTWCVQKHRATAELNLPNIFASCCGKSMLDVFFTGGGLKWAEYSLSPSFVSCWACRPPTLHFHFFHTQMLPTTWTRVSVCMCCMKNESWNKIVKHIITYVLRWDCWSSNVMLNNKTFLLLRFDFRFDEP